MRTAVSSPLTLLRTERLRAALVAFALGTVFIGGVGFAQIDAVHNAAHDGRHSFAFPCH